MMYFTLQNWMKLSLTVISSFLTKRFDIFKDIYDRMKYTLCIMNNNIDHISFIRVCLTDKTSTVSELLIKMVYHHNEYNTIDKWVHKDVWEMAYNCNMDTTASGMNVQITPDIKLENIRMARGKK